MNNLKLFLLMLAIIVADSFYLQSKQPTVMDALAISIVIAGSIGILLLRWNYAGKNT